MSDADISIQPIERFSYEDWLPLWTASNLGAPDPAVTAMTWARLTDPAQPVYGLGAAAGGSLAAILHYILHPVTGSLAPVCYMQDLYVVPGRRRTGIAHALITCLSALSVQDKWARIYWLTENDNEAAHKLYSGLAYRLPFSVYVMPVKS